MEIQIARKETPENSILTNAVTLMNTDPANHSLWWSIVTTALNDPRVALHEDIYLTPNIIKAVSDIHISLCASPH